MAETIDEISYNYEDGGKQVRRELQKEVLTRGSWTTVMFLYEELDRKADTWGDAKIAIVRYKKFGGTYRKQSSFNISSRKQAEQIIDVMRRWYASVEDKPKPPKAPRAPRASKAAKAEAETEEADEGEEGEGGEE